MPPDDADRLHELCELGQQRLMATQYRAAEAALVEAEGLALAAGDFDTLGRLYYPLQEARRQVRQLCGEGTVILDGWDDPDPAAVLDKHPQGQFLVAGVADLGPAVEMRRLIAERGLLAECFLAAAYPVSGRTMVAIVPTAEVALPPAGAGVDELTRLLPPFSLMLADDELPRGEIAGTPGTFAVTMGLWERLHLPHLNAARGVAEPRRRVEAYRRVIGIDYACEKAHQWLATTALDLGRASRSARDAGSSGATVA